MLELVGRHLCRRSVDLLFSPATHNSFQGYFSQHTKERANVWGSVEGCRADACVTERLWYWLHTLGGIKLSPSVSWNRCLREKWQTTYCSSSPDLFCLNPHPFFFSSFFTPASAACGVCCLGNSMTLDPAVEVLGWREGGACHPSLPRFSSGHRSMLCLIHDKPVCYADLADALFLGFAAMMCVG